MLCLASIASVVLGFGSPAPPADDARAGEAAAVGVAPLGAGTDASQPWPPAPGAAPPTDGASPSALPKEINAPLELPGPPDDRPVMGHVPLDGPRDPLGPGSAAVAAPFGAGPTLPVDRPDPRKLRAVRIELLVGPMWRIKTTEAMVQASVEFGRLQGFSGTFQVGTIVAPDRQSVAANDFPIGAGFVARRRFGERPLYGSVGLTAGILVHRAGTEFGLVHRVDPDFQVPLRFAWTAGKVGLSVALLQGFSVRARTYSRRGVEIWHRIPYRIGVAVGLHFDVGVGQARPRRSTR